MPVLFKEQPDSRKWTVGETVEAQYLYWMSGTNSDDLVRATALANTPLQISDGTNTLWRQHVEVHRVAWQKWDVTVPYKTAEPKQVGWSKVSFELVMQSTRITQPLATAAYAPPGQMAPGQTSPGVTPNGFTAPIGVNKDGRVEGCEIRVPEFTWTETFRMERANVESLAYRAILYAIGQNPVNEFPFRQFDPGVVLFGGASDSAVDKYQSDVTFRFAASPNLVNFGIGNNITVAWKGGHDYLDIYHEEAIDQPTGARIAIPRYAYVHVVHAASDFEALGIGN